MGGGRAFARAAATRERRRGARRRRGPERAHRRSARDIVSKFRAARGGASRASRRPRLVSLARRGKNKLRVGARRRVPGVSRSHFDRSIPTPESIEPPDRSTGAASVNGLDRPTGSSVNVSGSRTADRCDLFERRWRGDERSATRGRDSSKATFATRAAFFSLPPRATSPRAADGARLRRGSVPTARTPISRFPIRGGAPHTPRARRVPRGSAAGSDLARPCARRVLRVRPLAPRRVLFAAAPARVARGAALVHPPRQTSVARFLNATAIFAARV